MDTPLHPVVRGRWLLRVAAFVLLGGSVAGCEGFGDPLPPPSNMIAGGQLTLAKKEGNLFEWPDWEWEDFDFLNILPKSAPEISPPNAVVLQGDDLTAVKAPPMTTLQAKMALAHERYLAKDYARAVRIFHRIGDNEKNPPKMVQESLFYEAECHYFLDEWPKAGDTYMALMNKFPRNPYRNQVLARMFELADFWLEDTRQEMREYKEKENGQRWFVMPRFISFETKKPFLDREGRAIQLLEAVRYGSIDTPMADKALFLCGSVKFFDEDYKEADYYFSELQKKHVDSKTDKIAENATRLAIIAKHMSTGGADYDGRKVAEARMLVDEAMKRFPTMNEDKFLTNQLMNITKQEAEKDYKMGEFYERIDHPAAAVWQYELVTRRYPGMEPYYSDAVKRCQEIRQKMVKQPVVEPQPAPPHNQSRPLEQAPPPRLLPPDLGSGR
jgi:outer membrane protein assembly factor BamD (BamD/ComL family)